MKDAPSFDFSIQFAAAVGQVDAAAGKLFGVTVAEVGQAAGHFAFIDAAGKVVGVGGLDDAKDYPGAKRRLPLCMDEQSVASVILAAKASPRIKSREDHDDAISARAGFAENFRADGPTKAVCDLNLLDAYANRAVFLETATKTPELIGLSGDFKFTAEIVGERAMMRVSSIDAVDIVDRGALTHRGLFACKPLGVDSPATSQMAAKPKEDDTMPDFAAFKAMCESVAAYRAKNAQCEAQINECMAAIQPVRVPTPPGAPAPVPAGPGENPEAKLSVTASAMTPEQQTAFKSEMAALVATETAKATTAALVEFRKEMSALGLKPAAVPAAAPAANVTTEPAATTKTTTETFLSLKASVAAERKLSPSKAGEAVMRERPELYAAHLAAKGVISQAEFQAQLAARK